MGWYDHNNTAQHSVRMARTLWGAYRDHRRSIGSNASEGIRDHVIEELRRVGKLSDDLLEPDPKRV
jgi:hypothetical protein